MVENAPNKRYFLLSAILSLIVPGLGQTYNGQLRKGILFFSITYFIESTIFFLDIYQTFLGLTFWLIIVLLVRILIIAEAIYTSIKLTDFLKTRYNNWKFYLAVIIVVFGINVLLPLKDLGNVDASKFTSGSMLPTLQAGDHIIIDKAAYNNSHPAYGDIVAFMEPSSEEFWAFRIVGLPGDTVLIQNELISINGESPDVQLLNPNASQTYIYNERLPNNRIYKIYKFINPTEGCIINTENIIVPDESYFVLGDNRSDAYDSRYIGVVSKNRIKGKLLYIYYSSDWDRIGLNLTIM
jgi:signal peptidase I